MLALRLYLVKKKYKKSQNNRTDTLNYLSEKGKREQTFKTKELELKMRMYEMQAAQKREAEKQQKKNMKLN